MWCGEVTDFVVGLQYTSFRLWQTEKARVPSVVTFSGIVMLLRFSQPEKASVPISVTLLGIMFNNF